jgi:hypothetical protein
MTLLVPEPPRDIEAQLLAAIDVDHPKRACFCVPADQYLIPPSIDAYVTRRPEGTLVTLHKRLAEAFERSADDTTMAWILGYPEPKPVIAERCQGMDASRARVVQARDAEGNVITEATASPWGFLETCDALESHVPEDGQLVIMLPITAISRRVAMRWVQR